MACFRGYIGGKFSHECMDFFGVISCWAAAGGIERGSTQRTGACVRTTGWATLGATAGPLHASPRAADYR